MIARFGLAVLVAGLTLTAAAGAARPELNPQYGALTWAPGAEIAFGAVSGGTYIVNTDGSGLRRLAQFGGASRLSWSPDGRTLLVGAGSRMNTITTDGRVRKLGRGFDPVWAPDGRRIAFDSYGGFYVARADGTGAVRVAHSRYTEHFPAVVWSPDGRQLAYVACSAAAGSWLCEHSSAYDVYVSLASGGARHRITTKSAAPDCPAWSSKGVLAFRATDAVTGVRQPDGRVRTFHPGGCPVWSPDGSRYVVTRATGLGFLNADGTGRRYVRLPLNASYSDPVWSPDGRRIAVLVTRNSADQAQLYTVRPDGSDFRRVRLPAG